MQGEWGERQTPLSGPGSLPLQHLLGRVGLERVLGEGGGRVSEEEDKPPPTTLERGNCPLRPPAVPATPLSSPPPRD